MTSPFSARRLLPALAALSLLMLPSEPAQAQEQVPHVVVGPPGSATKVPLALPVTSGNAEAAQLWAIVKRDLELTGWFEIIDSAAYVEPVGTGLSPGDFKYEDWSLTGAVGLGKTGLSADGEGFRAEVWVYDVPGRRKLSAKAFRGKQSDLRILAHKVADHITWAMTGQHAPFNTRLTMAGSQSGNKEIYVSDFDGFGLTRITRNGSINLQPSWSPSADKVAFTSYVAGNPDVYVADLVKGQITRLSARQGLNTGASWHPNGKSLALTLSLGGDPDIYTIDATTGEKLARLTKNIGIDVSPEISPDGSQVAFVSERSGGAQVYIMGIDGSNVRRVTFQGSHNTDPSWSPDGRHLAFVSREGVFDVFTVRVDGTGIKRITQAAGDNEDPVWSPDGRYIAFSSTRTGSAHIWMSTADGTHQVQLTQGKGGFTNPDWSPSLPW